MKKNIIIIVSIIVVLLVVVAAVVYTKTPEEKKVVNQPVYENIVTDIRSDLQAVDFGNPDKDFEGVNKDIQGL